MPRLSVALLLGTLILYGTGADARAQDALPRATDLALARKLVLKIIPDPKQIIATIERPMVGMVEQMGVRDPMKAQALVQDAVMPILNEHVGELIDLYAQSYALLLSPADMQAIVAFYDTKAGQDLIKAQPAMAATQIQVITGWVGRLRPEISERTQALIRQRGWDHG